MTNLAATFATSAAEGMNWLTGELPREHGRLDPGLREQAFQLADPAGAWERLASLPGGASVTGAWQRRAATLASYRERLAGQRDPVTVLRALLHEHHVRVAGPDSAAEQVTGRLARACALRHLATEPEA